MSAQARNAREPLFTPRFAGLWAFAFVAFFSAFQLLPVIPFRILQLGGTTAQAGWFLAAYTFASAFAAPVMGTLADHVGRRRALITASIAFIVFSLAYGAITTLPLLLAVGAIHGALWSAILASSSAIMSDLIPESRRAQGMAYWGLASTSAVTVAPAIGLWVFHFGGWMALCVELAVLSVGMVIGGVLLPSTDTPRSAAGKLTIGEAWDWKVTRTALSMTMIAFGYGGITSYAGIYALERHVTPTSIYLTSLAASIVIVRVLTAHLADRLGPLRLLYPAFAMIPIAFTVLVFAHTRWQMIASAFLFGAGFGWMYPAFVTFMLTKTDPSRRARTFGSMVWAFDTGIGIGSLLVGSIGERYGLSTAFAAAAAISCLSIPVFVLNMRRL
jgi:MFS family permease